MFTDHIPPARKSKMNIIVRQILRNWRLKQRVASGKLEVATGSSGTDLVAEEKLTYINQVFADYLTYSGLSAASLQGKRVLEIGPGDNYGVALKFLIAGASKVVCFDKYFVQRDTEQERKIYQMLRARVDEQERTIIAEVIALHDGIQTNPCKLHCIHGVGIEEIANVFESGSFDVIVSRAVLEEVYDPDAAFAAMDKVLAPGGVIIHKIDLRDYGMFSSYGYHPLTFLTIPYPVYRLMTCYSPLPNRRRVSYYRRKMAALGYEIQILVTRIVGVQSEIIPHQPVVMLGKEYESATLSLLNQIRPQLRPEFRETPDEDLMVAGIFLIARKRLLA